MLSETDRKNVLHFLELALVGSDAAASSGEHAARRIALCLLHDWPFLDQTARYGALVFAANVVYDYQAAYTAVNAGVGLRGAGL
jgi:hypothetical protein